MARVPRGSAFVAVAALVFALPGQVHRATAADGIVHLIAAYDSSEEANLGGDVIADARSIVNAFRDNIPAGRLQVHSINGKKLNRASILSELSSLQVIRRDDSVVFFFTGHGAFDNERGHFFSLPHSHEEVLRSEVEAAIVSKKPRTGVIITDCCAAGAKYSGPLPPEPLKALKEATDISPLFHHLFFARYGLISITSSKPGEVSLTRGDGKGSLFTYPFAAYLENNAHSRLSWKEVVGTVATTVQADFNKITAGKGVDKDGDGVFEQKGQTVCAFILTPALGARVKLLDNQLKVVQVIPLSPADCAGLTVDDQLIEVNGEAVQTEQQYGRAVDQSPRKIRLTVLHAGNRTELSGELNPPN
jgi:hypothetical protein